MIGLPPEEGYSEIEHDLIDNEPFGLFPGDQNSLWGQMRHIFAGKLQVISDKLTTYWFNLDPRTVDINDVGNWEDELNIPRDPAKSLESRRAFIQSRRERGPFTRTRRRRIVESFIIPTFGPALDLPFPTPGVLFSGHDSLAGTYNIVENIPAFTYDVRIINTITVDVAGLTRELDRVTPAHIAFTITSTPTP